MVKHGYEVEYKVGRGQESPTFTIKIADPWIKKAMVASGESNLLKFLAEAMYRVTNSAADSLSGFDEQLQKHMASSPRPLHAGDKVSAMLRDLDGNPFRAATVVLNRKGVAKPAR